MNLELEPEEYQDPNSTIDVILEALLLLYNNGNEKRAKSSFMSSLGFPPARLRNGFGPEVIWTLNVLADRALELSFESQPQKPIRILYCNKTGPGSSKGQDSITIGQPLVGGGLTTRPLGKYQIDDESLLFDPSGNDKRRMALAAREKDDEKLKSLVDPEEWYKQVEESSQVLDSIRLVEEDSENLYEDWQSLLRPMSKSKKQIGEFIETICPLLNNIAQRTERQLQVIKSREKFLRNNLRSEIEDFYKIWREYNRESKRLKDLELQVDNRTDRFEMMNEKLKEFNDQIETRKREMNDGSHLKEIELRIERIKDENREFDVRIGLLLGLYAEIHGKRLVNQVN